MGPFEYRKKVHGPAIAAHLPLTAIEELRPQFEGFFT